MSKALQPIVSILALLISKKSTKSVEAIVHAEESEAEASPEVPTESSEVVVAVTTEEPVDVEAITRETKLERQSAWSKMKKIITNKLKKQNFSE